MPTRRDTGSRKARVVTVDVVMFHRYIDTRHLQACPPELHNRISQQPSQPRNVFHRHHVNTCNPLVKTLNHLGTDHVRLRTVSSQEAPLQFRRISRQSGTRHVRLRTVSSQEASDSSMVCAVTLSYRIFFVPSNILSLSGESNLLST